MNEKNLLDDITSKSLNELTDLADKIIKNLENEINLENKSEDYANLIKINKLIEKKFQKDLKEISEKSNFKIKEIKSILRKLENDIMTIRVNHPNSVIKDAYSLVSRLRQGEEKQYSQVECQEDDAGFTLIVQ